MLENTEELKKSLQEITKSLKAARTTLESIQEKNTNLRTTDGISLLSLKHHALLSYIRSLVLISSRRILGDSLTERSDSIQPFSAIERDARGSHLGDVVDSTIENRLLLEKVEVLQSKMRYQIEKLLKVATEPAQDVDPAEDPLAFRPNPQALLQADVKAPEEKSYNSNQADSDDEGDKIYRPPRLVPMPYVEKSKNQRRRERPPVPSALAALSADPSQPFIESTSGLGGAPSLASGRAQYLQRVKDYEEENFTRMVLKKKDARQRARDEQDLALGGDLGSTNRRRGGAGGLEDEFGEVLRSISRTHTHGQGDGYEELRSKGKKSSVLERSRTSSRKRDVGGMDDGDAEPRRTKRSRFEMDRKVIKKKLNKR
ncbi:hypothetical protein CVT24_011422 [Panaeolus cyanescens]|uniref:Neuroguidin n=1 Tax=Panaeolus cyanescens TaxID=181874 RepID=A0A409YGU9_9AGAR|nr:hypothetical protein CVT24_011422 [Panaeolus cyanescens]